MSSAGSVNSMDSVFEPFLLSLIAGTATGIGGIIVLMLKRVSDRVASFSMGLASGVMLLVAFNNLFLEAALHFMAKTEQYAGADGEKLERTKPLTSTALGELLKRSSRDVRKILTSLNLAPRNAPHACMRSIKKV